MAATLWSRTFGIALVPAARICRCSQGALALHALRAGRFVSTRYVSTDIPVPDHKVEKAKWSSEPLRDQETDHGIEEPAEDRSQPENNVANADQPKFETLDGAVSSRTLRALIERPFRLLHMSPVQAAVLPLLPGLVQLPKEGEEPTCPRDLLVRARTGTGKTLAFLIPAVESRLNTLRAHAEQVASDTASSSKLTLTRAVDHFAKKNVGALIISPTRELATQIANEAIKLTQHHDKFGVQLLVGGLPKRKQLREWNLGRRDIIVATPGRLRDFIENDPGFKEDLGTTQTFILDEADTLLEMGFREEIDAISEYLPEPPARQTFMFSATMPTAIEQVARKVLSKNHTFVNCVPLNAAPTHFSIPQYYTAVPSADEQVPHILRLIAEDQLANPGKSKVLIFLPTTRLVQLYSTIITQLGHQVLPAGSRTRLAEMHSKKAMNSRMKTSDWYRSDKSGASVMITSDVSARGVDYPGVTRVIQIGVPQSRDSYVHRVGRTGRGKDLSTGRADLVLLPWELGFLTWQLMDIPLKELTTNQLTATVTDLAQKHDADPSTTFPQEAQRDSRDRRRGDRDYRERRAPLRFEAHVASRLEKIPEAVKELQVSLEKDDVVEALTTIMSFYASNASKIRVQQPVAVAGIHQWAEALTGEKVRIRVPREFLDKSYRPAPRKASSWADKRTRETIPWMQRGRIDKRQQGDYRQRDEGHGEPREPRNFDFNRDISGDDRPQRRERRPWSSERPSYDNDRPPRRRFDDDRAPRRRFDEDRPPRRRYDDERSSGRRYGDDRPPRRQNEDEE